MSTVSKMTCPECKAVLRPTKPVPVGKKVTCPKCKGVFLAEEEKLGEELPQPQGKPKGAPSKPASPEAKKPAKPAGESYGLVEEPKAEKKKKKDDDDDLNPYAVIKEPEVEEDDKEKINYAPDTSVKDPRGPAQEQLVGPTNTIVISGIVGFIGWLALLVLILIPVLFPLTGDEGTKESPIEMLTITKGVEEAAAEFRSDLLSQERTAAQADVNYFIVWGIDLTLLSVYGPLLFVVYLLPIFLGMGFSAVLVSGAVKGQNLESREWGIASCIMVMMPVNAGGFLMVMTILLNFLMGMIIDDQATINWYAAIFVILTCLGEVLAGVLALMVFLKPDVIEGFEYKPQ